MIKLRPIEVFLKDMTLMIRKPMILISFIGVAILPMLYSGFLVAGSWDPYGKTNKLPVAVVNLDKGAQYGKKTMNVGSDFVSELKKNDDFKWEFVRVEDAKAGMIHNKYYITVTIPADFSAKAATLMDEQPKQAEIIFEPNSDYNIVGGQIGTSSIKELKNKLSSQITEAYTQTMFDQVDEISKGFKKAGNGATLLNDGVHTLEQGASTLKDNLLKLSTGTTTLQNGIKPLMSGVSGLQQGTASLKEGANQLNGGLKQLTAAENLIEAGSIQSQQGVLQLKQGLQTSYEGSKKLNDGLVASTAASVTLADGTAQLTKSLEALMKEDPQLASNTQLKQLLTSSQAISQGSAQLKEGQEKLLTGSQQLDAGQQQLLQGATKLNDGQIKFTEHIKQFGLKLNEAAQGMESVTTGTSKVIQGVTNLQGGLTQLNTGVDHLANGSQKLDSGAGQLKEGAIKLVDGSTHLADQLTAAAGETSQVKSSDETVQMFANPVKVTENPDRKLSHYGMGIAPYFLSLALFMGGLVFTTIFSVRDSNVQGASAMGRYVSRTLTLVVMSFAQSIFASLILLYGIGLVVQSIPLFFLFTFISSLTFILIIQALVTWLDQPGRFLVIILMIFQLTSSAGTFPLEMLPNWMQRLNPWLPMSHSIFGFKAIIATGDYGFMGKQIGYLAIYAVVFAALTLLYFMRKQAKPKSKTLQTISA
jgi:putative membrane protein